MNFRNQILLLLIFAGATLCVDDPKERYTAMHAYFSGDGVDIANLMATIVLVTMAVIITMILQHQQHMKQLKKHHEENMKHHEEIMKHLTKKDK